MDPYWQAPQSTKAGLWALRRWAQVELQVNLEPPEAFAWRELCVRVAATSTVRQLKKHLNKLGLPNPCRGLDFVATGWLWRSEMALRSGVPSDLT